MGTNYYWRYNVCSCCNRYDEQHVGKSSSGFQGVFDENPDTYALDVPVVTSWAEWKAVLRHEKFLPLDTTHNGQLWDEYGAHLDVEEFIAEREAVAPEFKRKQYDYVATHTHPHFERKVDQVAPRGDWLDADGWSFYGAEFS